MLIGLLPGRFVFVFNSLSNYKTTDGLNHTQYIYSLQETDVEPISVICCSVCKHEPINLDHQRGNS